MDPKPQEGSRWCETPEGADGYGLAVREGLLMKKAWFTEWIWEGREEGKIENCEGESWKERKKEARNDNGKEQWIKRGKKERWSERGKIDKKMHSSVLWGGGEHCGRCTNPSLCKGMWKHAAQPVCVWQC